MNGHGAAGSLAEWCRAALQIGLGVMLQSTLLLGLALFLDRALRRHGPALRSLLYRVTLAAVLTCGLASVWVGRHFQPLWSVSLPFLAEPPAAALPRLGSTGTFAGPDARSPGLGAMDPLGLWVKTPPAGSEGAGGLAVPASARWASLTGSSSMPTGRSHASSRRWSAGARFAALSGALTGLWSAGALFLLLRLLFCQVQLLRLRRRAAPLWEPAVQSLLAELCPALGVRPPLVLAGPGVHSPFLTGLWRPAILLPADADRLFDRPTLRIILTHELVHLARRDCAWNLLASLACAVGWLQPLLWVIRRRLAQTTEELCDAEVVRLAGDARAYAACLFTLSERFLPSTAERVLGVGMAPFRSSLGRRIQRILDSHRRRPLPLSAGLRAAVALGAATAAALTLFLVAAVAAPGPAARAATDISGLPLEPAPGSDRARRRSVLLGVAELEKPVTYTETKIPLGELVQKVAADTGVPLTAAPSAADEPVAVIVKDLPARELLEQLADLLDYQWMRGGHEGAWRYGIYQDVAGRQREELLRQAARAGVEKRLREQISRCVTLASLPPAEIQRHAAEDERQREAFFKLPPSQRMLVAPRVRPQLDDGWIFRSLASPVNRALAQFLGRLSPEQWTALRSGLPLVFSSSPQPGELALPETMVRGFRSARPNMDTGWGIGDPEMAEKQRQIQRDREAQWRVAPGYRVKLRMDVSHFPLTGLLSLQANASALQEGGAPDPADRFALGEPEGTSLQIAAEPNPPYANDPENTPERDAALERDPVLGIQKTVKLEPKPGTRPGEPPKLWWTVREMLPSVAGTYGVSIIADAYEANPVNVPLPGMAPIALHLLLDRYAAPFYHWDHHDRLIRLRNREWFFDRPREVPLRLVRRWREMLDQYGGLPLEETLTAVTTLNDAQLQSADDLLQRSASEARQIFPQPLYPARQVLRLYAALTPGQQQALWSGRLLAVAAMTPPQRALFLAALQETDRSRQPEGEDSASAPAALLPPDAALALTHQRQVRVVQRSGDSTTVSTEPAPEPQPAAPSATPAPATASPPAARRREAVTRDPIADLTFELVSSPENRDQVHVTVAAPG